MKKQAKPFKLLDKTFCGDELADVERTVYEALEDYPVTTDKHGFPHGAYRVVITWDPEG